jgi:hypothetical protein
MQKTPYFLKTVQFRAIRAVGLLVKITENPWYSGVKASDEVSRRLMISRAELHAWRQG